MYTRNLRISQQQGIALIVVLWMLVVVVLIAMTYSQGIRTELMLAANTRNQVEVLGLAEEGIWRGAMMALSKSSNSNHLRLDGSVYQMKSEKGKLQVSLQSTNGLIDLNRAAPEVLQSLFHRVTGNAATAQAITDALLDWRDEDDSVRPLGAESADYASMGYSAKNGMMNSVDELRRIKGVTQEIFDKVLPFVTVYSGQSRIAIQSAPSEVVLSLPGVAADRGDVMLTARSTGSGADFLSFVPVETKRYIGSGTDEFIRISSVAEINGTRSGIVAVVKLEPSGSLPVTIVSWRERIADVFK